MGDPAFPGYGVPLTEETRKSNLTWLGWLKFVDEKIRVKASDDAGDVTVNPAVLTETDVQAALEALVTAGVTGNIVQVVAGSKTDTFSSTTTGGVDITGMSVAITPKFAGSKIIPVAIIGGAGHSSDTFVGVGWTLSDNTPLVVGDTAGSRTRSATVLYPRTADGLDSGAVIAEHSPGSPASITYKLRMFISGGTGYINRTATDTDVAGYHRTASYFMALEVAA